MVLAIKLIPYAKSSIIKLLNAKVAIKATSLIPTGSVLLKEILSVKLLTRIINVHNVILIISLTQAEYVRLLILSAKKATKMDPAKVAMMAMKYQEPLVFFPTKIIQMLIHSA